MRLLDLVVSGLAVGSLYALLAVGFSLLWQTSRTINFAQGDFSSVAAFIYLGFAGVATTPLAALAAVVLSSIIFGPVAYYLLFRRLKRSTILNTVVATVALGLLIENGIVAFYSPKSFRAPSLFPTTHLSVGGVSLSLRDLLNLATALVAVVALRLFLKYTRLGRALRGTAQNPTVASTLGISTSRMTAIAFTINAALAAIVGILIAPIYFVRFDLGLQLTLAAFYAAIIGGFNEIKGAIAGGLIVGVLGSLIAGYVSTQYGSAVVLLLMVVVLLARPIGLLGSREVVEYK